MSSEVKAREPRAATAETAGTRGRNFRVSVKSAGEVCVTAKPDVLVVVVEACGKLLVGCAILSKDVELLSS